MKTPLTTNEIASLIADKNGITHGRIYVSIPHYNHKVFKAHGEGVMNGTMTEWVEVLKNEHKGCHIRIYKDDDNTMGDRIDEDGNTFTDL